MYEAKYNLSVQFVYNCVLYRIFITYNVFELRNCDFMTLIV